MAQTYAGGKEYDGLELPPRLITRQVMTMPVSDTDPITYYPHNHGPYDINRCRLADRLRATGKKQGKKFTMLHRGPVGNLGGLMIWRVE